MSAILVFVRKWNACYRMLRCRKGFSFVDFVHYMGCGCRVSESKPR